MASRRERCSWCQVQLWVPPGAQTVRCGACQAITRVPYGPVAQTLDSIHHVANIGVTYLANVVSANKNPAAGTCSYGYNNYGYNGYYGQPQPPPPPPPPPKLVLPLPSAHGRKRALLCGVSYRGKNYKIKGTINDVNCMRYFLVEKLGFPNDSILTLTEDEINPLRIPTKENIRLAMRWLVNGCQSGDSLVFYFSGHGSRQRGYKKDDTDAMDETLCPLDLETEGMIIDDEINATIVRPLPKGATLHAIIDACYSGTVLDLPFLCKINRLGSNLRKLTNPSASRMAAMYPLDLEFHMLVGYEGGYKEGYYAWEDQHRRQRAAYKGTSGGLAICISACEDDQICIDTTAMAGNTSTGALTYSFIQAVENEPGLTYGRLLSSMRQATAGTTTGGLRLNGPIASLLNRTLFRTEIPAQEPQLSSSEKFDIYSNQFIP